MPGHFTFYTHHIEGNTAFFDENEARHALQVLRYNEGSPIEFTDGLGVMYKGNIALTGKKNFTAEILQKHFPQNLSKLTLAVGTIKHTDRLEWMVEKACEFGVEALVLMQTENTVKQRVHVERMQRILVSALKQSHGCRLPRLIFEDFSTVLNQTAEHRFICHCRSELQGPQGSFQQLQGSCLVLVGPEGDFTSAEVMAAHKAGFRDLLLGNSVLRSETAAIAVAGVYNFTVK